MSFASVSKRALVQNYSNGEEFDLHENERADKTNFPHRKGSRSLTELGKVQLGNELLGIIKNWIIG